VSEPLARGGTAARQRANEILNRLEGVDKPVVIEVGVNTGILSQLLLSLRPDLTLYMVDSWRGEQEQPDEYKQTNDMFALRTQAAADAAKARVCAMAGKFGNRAKVVVLDSVAAAETFEDKSVDLVFIDADHSYEGCKADIEAYTRVTRKWISGHDYRNPYPPYDFSGVDRAVEEAFGEVETGKNVTWFKCLYA